LVALQIGVGKMKKSELRRIIREELLTDAKDVSKDVEYYINTKGTNVGTTLVLRHKKSLTFYSAKIGIRYLKPSEEDYEEDTTIRYVKFVKISPKENGKYIQRLELGTLKASSKREFEKLYSIEFDWTRLYKR